MNLYQVIGGAIAGGAIGGMLYLWEHHVRRFCKICKATRRHSKLIRLNENEYACEHCLNDYDYFLKSSRVL